MTSDGFFELEHLPRRVAVVGSGYIAVELAGVLRALGSEVTLCIRHDTRAAALRLAARREARWRDARERHRDRDDGEHDGARARASGALTLEAADGRKLGGFDTVLWAIGRTPNVAAIGLESAGVTLDAEGFVAVDRYQNTSTPGIYAVGDVTGQAELTPVAIAAGRRLADRVFGGMTDRHLRYDVIPTRRVLAPADRHGRACRRRRRASATRASRSASTSPSSSRCSTR